MYVAREINLLVPIEEAARTLHTTSISIYMHIKRKLIAGHEVGERWFVEAESLAVFLARHDGTDPALVHHARGCDKPCK
ncbi:hypothetical protein [Trichloromonas sp.]|uniref:hypothetical protein n=1 Tax=Trichloromonas sp. TaxID=3069249 RepID=UPI002A4D5B40|nr:hypothetical protein [Trichloromonas sp.]